MFDTILVNPIINVLLVIYHLLLAVNIPYALGFSIILLTALLRLVLYPLTAQQLKASKKMQDVAPLIAKLKEKHKGDSKKLQQETMSMYQKNGINPAAGCLPVIVQLPVIWAIYTVFQKIVTLKPQETLEKVNAIAYSDWLKLNTVWDTSFFGLPLGQTPSDLMKTVGMLILLAPVLTGLFQMIQSKMIMPRAVEKKAKKKGGKESMDFATAFQSQSLYIFPAMIGFFSFTLPFGLTLYWNTFTIFGIIQQYKIQGFGGLQDWIDKYSSKKSLKGK